MCLVGEGMLFGLEYVQSGSGPAEGIRSGMAAEVSLEEGSDSVFMFRGVRVGFARKANGRQGPRGYPGKNVQETKGCWGSEESPRLGQSWSLHHGNG